MLLSPSVCKLLHVSSCITAINAVLPGVLDGASSLAGKMSRSDAEGLRCLPQAEVANVIEHLVQTLSPDSPLEVSLGCVLLVASVLTCPPCLSSVQGLCKQSAVCLSSAALASIPYCCTKCHHRIAEKHIVAVMLISSKTWF